MMANRILVVDDDNDTVEYLACFLEDNGYQVKVASDAASAMGVLQTFTPDVVLVDVLMPGRSGLDLLVSLRKDARWQDLRLVVITGNDQILQDDCQSYLGTHHGVRGPDALLGKPIDRKTLLAILNRLQSCERDTG